MRILFMGTPDFAVPILRSLVEQNYDVVGVVTQPDRPKGRKQLLTPSPVKVEALQHHIPVFQPERIKDEEELAQLAKLQPDLLITAAYGQILPQVLLDLPTYGAINVHASLLPQYRGGAPIHQAIIDGQSKSGVTIMYMVKKMDAGDILAQVEVPILEMDHVGSMHDKLSVAGAQLLLETIPPLIRGEITPVQQDETKVTYAYNIQREQERIDWTQSNVAVYNQIRGLHPWPVAYTLFAQQVFKIWWGEKVNETSQQKPGTILSLDEGILVQTGDGAIRITDLQPAGKKRMCATDYLNGAGAYLKVGMQFES
ncbi:methionyl-tRNA formyltransferase [Rubeoparvulum massiliense]|uniref:methionyl-tRNA formyltransferase n=1 Tax=Rubeoparvulum massiliense TaxID=1631346 RepID=UPI00065DD769|nr:methionyl-tRNA formyltransferase [Rubeoparvulum massiliense]